MKKKERFKILIISEVFYPEIGSGANRITNLVIQLKENGYKVDVITSEPSYPNKEMYTDDDYRDYDKEIKIEKDSNIKRISTSRIKPTAKFFNRIYIYMHFLCKCVGSIIFRIAKYDLIIATTPSPFTGFVGIVAKFRYRCKYILDIRDLWPECIKNIGLFRRNKLSLKLAYIFEGIILKFTDSIVINSEGFEKYLIDRGYKKSINFIPNGLTKEELDEYKEISKNAKKNEKFTIIYTGMIGLAQNVKSIVRVANNLRNIEFRIIGAGIQKTKVLELIKHYNLSNIKVYDPMPKKKIVIEVSKCHIAMAHLRRDSAFDLVIPGKIIDYIGMGIPIVAGVEGYTAEVLKKSKGGIAVVPDDCKNMSKAIMYMYSNAELRKLYSKNGYEYCMENFCFEKNVVEYIELIERTIRRNKNEKESVHVCMESLHQ